MIRLTLAGVTAGLQSTATEAQAQLVISEIHYNPSAPTAPEILLGHDDSDDFEFVEFANLGTGSVSLANVALFEGITFSFTAAPIQTLAPGARLVIVNKLAGFRARYPTVTSIAGVYSGNLSNSGETLAWRQPSGGVEYLTFSDLGLWTKLADGRGWSLHRTGLDVPASNPAAWRASLWRHGSPAAADPPASGVVFNEILSHTDPPLVDMIELYNTTAGPVDIGGWRISDDHDELDKYVIPGGTILPAGGYWIVTETQWRGPGVPLDRQFGLDAVRGESLYLSATAGAVIRVEDSASFGAQFNGESFGRWPNGTGAWHPQTIRSPAAATPGIRIPRVVISEIQYNPVAPNVAWEYLELANLEPYTISLQEWTLSLGTVFTFPPATLLAPGQTLLVVPFDPVTAEARSHFINAWGMPADTPMLGIATGRLSDAGTSIALNSPDQPPTDEPTFYPAVVEDHLFYSPRAPWPTAAGGQGQALHRSDRRLAGTLAVAWSGAPPSPGRLPFYDEDGDQIADDWELRHFTSRATANGKLTDADLDGARDADEYVAGTHPLDPDSRLMITQAVFESESQALRVHWATVTNVRYVVAQAPHPGGVWTQATVITSGPSALLPPPPGTNPVFYRIQVAP